MHESNPQELVVTFHDTILSNRDCNLDDNIINKFKAEETDTKLVCHGISQAKRGYQHIVIRTVDTDVLILLIPNSHLFIEGGVVSALVQFGVGHNVRFYDIFELRVKIGTTK